MYIASPFEYEALQEIPASETFYGDLDAGQGAARASLLKRFEPFYQEFRNRAGEPYA
jgi:hypothetical protein